MQLIHQRASHDCGVAALAMFTDHTYEEMMEVCLLPDRDGENAQPIYREGWGMNKEHIALKHLGLWSYDNQLDGAVRRFSKPLFIEAEFFRNIAWGRRALMMVPSLNIEGGFHFVCYDGQNVLDPNDPEKGKKIYTKFDELKPIEIYVYKEIK